VASGLCFVVHSCFHLFFHGLLSRWKGGIEMSNEAKCLNHCRHPLQYMRKGRCAGPDGEHGELECGHVCAFAPPMTDSEREVRRFDHFSIVPFVAICGADVPNQNTTQTPERAKCVTCWQYWKEFESTRVSQAQGSERVAAEIVRSFKYSNRGDGMEDADPHSDDNPDYIRAAIDERLEECAVALAASPSLSGAPGELKEVQECDKCDLCEDHHSLKEPE
jgi:hypothetical protein